MAPPRARTWSVSTAHEPWRSRRRFPTTRATRRVRCPRATGWTFRGWRATAARSRASSPRFAAGSGCEAGAATRLRPGWQPNGLRAGGKAQQMSQSSKKSPDRHDCRGLRRRCDGLRANVGAVANARHDHQEKTTTEDYWTWHLASFPWERHSSGSRCWSGLLGRWRLAAGGTARKVVGRRYSEPPPVRRWRGLRLDSSTGIDATSGSTLRCQREGFGTPRVQASTDTVASEQTFEGRSPREHRAVVLLQGRQPQRTR
jgi:hypothetical protein